MQNAKARTGKDRRSREWGEIKTAIGKGQVRVSQRSLTPKERQSINAKRYRLRHPERTEKNRRDRQRKYTLKHRFSLSIEQYEVMFREQGGRCAICREFPNKKNLAVDHDHITGAVRGLLCDNCNRAIGQMRDDVQIVKRAAAYLERASLPEIPKSSRVGEPKHLTIELFPVSEMRI